MGTYASFPSGEAIISCPVTPPSATSATCRAEVGSMMPRALLPLLATSSQPEVGLAAPVPKASIPRSENAKGSCDHRMADSIPDVDCLRMSWVVKQMYFSLSRRSIIILYCFEHFADPLFQYSPVSTLPSVLSSHDVDQRLAPHKPLHL